MKPSTWEGEKHTQEHMAEFITKNKTAVTQGMGSGGWRVETSKQGQSSRRTSLAKSVSRRLCKPVGNIRVDELCDEVVIVMSPRLNRRHEYASRG